MAANCWDRAVLPVASVVTHYYASSFQRYPGSIVLLMQVPYGCRYGCCSALHSCRVQSALNQWDEICFLSFVTCQFHLQVVGTTTGVTCRVFKL